ncbi:autotransporter domain-containing protein [Candidatus Ruminimicrobiellum ovillum]|uniref:autotransporter domain-containing protein n=1 Tax=Candidatus Ruminimicrobiellum ovillum TaxID=1947927 RepID=UPI0035595F8C
MKRNKSLVKIFPLMLSIIFLNSQVAFATYEIITADWDFTANRENYSNYHEKSGHGGVFLVKGKLTVRSGATFEENSAHYSGGAITAAGGTVYISADANFKNNYARYGGAISLTEVPAEVIVGNRALFEDNYTYYEKESESDPYTASDGGAIWNMETFTIGDYAYFKGNHVDEDGCEGGAIYNLDRFTIGNYASFVENYSEKGSGGAIHNSVWGRFKMGVSYFKGNSANEFGGAIYNSSEFTIDDSTAQDNEPMLSQSIQKIGGENFPMQTVGTIFMNNVANYGGAVYNDGSKIKSGTDEGLFTMKNKFDVAVFDDNYANTAGGAIYNKKGTVELGNNMLFVENGAGDYGGALYNEGGTITIGSGAQFIENETIDDDGGAIYNEEGTITVGSNALFEGNTSQDDGGAIYNGGDGIFVTEEGVQFIENESNYWGGAITNWGEFTIKDGAKFIGNTSTYSGGAIYNGDESILNLIANTKNVEFTWNENNGGQSNAIFNNGGTINLWASDKADIIFNDPITGTSDGSIAINASIPNYEYKTGTGKILLNADMGDYNGEIWFYSGTIKLGEDGTLFGSNNGITVINVTNATIDMINGKTANAEFGRDGLVAITDKLNLKVDADLKNKSMDMALFSVVPIGTGKVNVKEINIIEDNEGTTRVDFACIQEGKITTVGHAKSVLYNYDAKLNYGTIEFYIDGNYYGDEPGYYYTFTRKGANPVTAIGAISASVGGYATQSIVAEQAFAGMNSKFSNNKKSAGISSSNLYVSAGNQVFDETGKIERGAWLRPFVLNETVTVGGLDVDNSLYGTLAGIDLPMGQDKQLSFYLGYAGSKQEVEEVKSNQTGYVLGATGMLMKEKWYLGATANMIFNKASVDTDDGINDIDMNMFGIAVKAGYNYVINEKWTLEPNATLMYGTVNCGEYETALTKVDSLSVNNILFEPQVKARLQMKDGWQPYGLLGYAANLSSKPTIKTELGDVDLDSIDGYVEFGAGVNKDFINTAWSCYAQLTGRSGGRTGFAGNLGIKYKF